MITDKVVDDAADDAQLTLGSFIRRHQAAAIPAMIGACVLWAVEHGGTDVVKGSLASALKMADEMHEAMKGRTQ